MTSIHLVFGPQGAGKSTYARQLAERTQGVHLSIDSWMATLFGPDVPQPMDIAWIMQRVRRCEQCIWATSEKIVRAGGTVVLDLGFMKVRNRDAFRALAQEQGFAVQLHYLQAAHALRRQRVLARNAERGDTFSFEVTPGMFDFMEAQFEAPSESESSMAHVVHTD